MVKKQLSLIAAMCLLNTHAIAAGVSISTSTVFVPLVVENARDLMPNYPSTASFVLPELSYEEEQEIVALIQDPSRSYVAIKRNTQQLLAHWRRVGSRRDFAIWQLHIRSPGAVAIQAFFTVAELAPGLKIKAYSGEPGVMSHTGERRIDTLDTGQAFWSTKVPGNTLVVELWSPHTHNIKADPFPFSISYINHYFRNSGEDSVKLKYFSLVAPRQSQQCNPFNDLCDPGDGTEIWRAISLLTNYGSGGTCTGTFLNSKGGEDDGIYLLTAFHCIDNLVSSKEMRVGSRISAQIDTSISDCAVADDKLTGNEIRFIAGNEKADWALLWVNIAELSRSDGRRFRAANTPLLLGWNANTLATGSSLETLHHADGDDQNYARFSITSLTHKARDVPCAEDPSKKCSEFNPCLNPSECSHYNMESITGGVEGGASGASWWGPSYQVRAVHTNGFEKCTGWSSRFDKMYEDGRLYCALNYGDDYYPERIARCDDSTRPSYSNDSPYTPKLVDLSLSSGIASVALSPTFRSETKDYTATVASYIEDIVITATPNERSHAVYINGYLIRGSATLSLGVGNTPINIVVHNLDGSLSSEYTVVVERTQPYLFALSLSRAILTPPFHSLTTRYTATVDHSLTHLRIRARGNDSLAGIPDGRSHHLIISVNGAPLPFFTDDTDIRLQSGDNRIIVIVSTADGAAETIYIVDIERPQPCLTELFLSTGLLDPLFGNPLEGCGDENLRYRSTVASYIEQVTVTAMANSDAYSIDINGERSDGRAVVPLDVGNNRITVEVRGTDDRVATEYTIRVERAQPYLRDLFLSPGTLKPSFDGSRTRYTAEMDSDLISITVITDDALVYRPDGSLHSDGRPHDVAATVNDRIIDRNASNIRLDEGDNTIRITVKTADGKAELNYSIEARQSQPCLVALSLSTGSLSPRFNQSQEDCGDEALNYRANVPSYIEQVTVIATANDDSYSITVNGRSASEPIPLNIGNNTLAVAVRRANDDTATNYTLTVARALPSLLDLALSSGTLDPPFNKTHTHYTAIVHSGITAVAITVRTDDEAVQGPDGKPHQLTASANGTPADINTSDIPLNIGTNSIRITVRTADSKATVTYALTVRRIEPCLTILSLSAGTLSPEFTRPGSVCGDSSTSYRAVVINDVSEIDVIAIADNDAHTITVNGNRSTTVPLAVGDNMIDVAVITPDDKVAANYKIVVRRLSSATLNALSATAQSQEIALKPSFNAISLSYTASIDEALTSIALRPSAASGRTIRVRYTPKNGSAIDQSVMSGDAITITSLSKGSNIIYIDVTHESATEQYRLVVYLGTRVRTKVFLEGSLKQ